MVSQSSRHFYLQVQRVEAVCLFELSWGQGQKIMARVPYPSVLEKRYQDWQRQYLTFYSQLSDMELRSADRLKDRVLATDPNSLVTDSASSKPSNSLRGKAVTGGSVNLPPPDWHERLVQAETTLTYEFQRWLRHSDLFEVRATIAGVKSRGTTSLDLPKQEKQPTTEQLPEQAMETRLFLSCYPLELARFPWETWEIGAEFATRDSVQIVRSSLTIHAASGATHLRYRRHRRPRILIILGDSTGLDFREDRKAVQSLTNIADITFEGWQPNQSPEAVKIRVCKAIADDDGWDLLLFAGHSNEKELMGGQLAIAPGSSITMQELAPSLSIAKEKGLQFALFNSCNGLDIAEFLMDLGLSQVVVMREPIHTRVAQAFLWKFMQSLANHLDVQEAMQSACQWLKLEQQFTYPSANLVPSLFCHPDATLFRIPKRGLRQKLKTLIPLRYEAIALTACLGLSLLPSAQSIGLDQRLRTQAIYRQLTHQVPATDSPPVVLVQVDEESLKKDRRMGDPFPIDRSYLADLIQTLAQQKASIIGIDYLLDRPADDPKMDQRLQEAVNQAVDQEMWLVFASIIGEDGQEVSVNQKSEIAQPSWMMGAHIDVLMGYMTLQAPGDDCRLNRCPFAYLLSLLQQATQDPDIAAQIKPPSRSNQADLRAQFINTVELSPPVDSAQVPNISLTSEAVNALYRLERVQERSRFHPLTLWSNKQFGQTWFAQLLDFSIPPDAVYARIPAWALLDESVLDQSLDLSGRTVMIVPGGYTEAGIDEAKDNEPLPSATKHWYSIFPPVSHLISDPTTNAPLPSGTKEAFPKGEAHAYMVHHFLTQRKVIHVPDSWVVAIAALFGYVTAQWIKVAYPHSQWTHLQRRRLTLGFTGLTGLSGLASLQLYISAGVLLPWTLPTVLVWIYILRVLRRKPNV
ncbi:MAG: CHASE2 domain-containing protein [Cyanobacteria bacterium P01_F01_bin.150]